MGNVIMSGIVPPLEAPVGGTPLSTLAVGSTLSLNVNGTAKDFLVVHQGKPSSLYDDSCDGVWLLMKDCYEERAIDSGGDSNYPSSEIHTYLNGTFLNMFDADIKSVVKQVKIPYRTGTSGLTVKSGANGVSTRVFLLSYYEVGYEYSDSTPTAIDGAKLDYFITDDANNSHRNEYVSESTIWWLRTMVDTEACGTMVHATSSWAVTGVKQKKGIRPALILPSDALLAEDGTIIV